MSTWMEKHFVQNTGISKGIHNFICCCCCKFSYDDIYCYYQQLQRECCWFPWCSDAARRIASCWVKVIKTTGGLCSSVLLRRAYKMIIEHGECVSLTQPLYARSLPSVFISMCLRSDFHRLSQSLRRPATGSLCVCLSVSLFTLLIIMGEHIITTGFVRPHLIANNYHDGI